MKCPRCKGKGTVEAFFCGAEVTKPCPVCFGLGIINK
jgi:DnaJ-class molecular chaperone